MYLHKIGKVNSKRCSSCWRVRHEDVTETVIHFLFECPTFDYERHDFDHTLGAQLRNLRTILGNKEYVTELIRYIGRTGRLKKQGEVPPNQSWPINGTKMTPPPFRQSINERANWTSKLFSHFHPTTISTFNPHKSTQIIITRYSTIYILTSLQHAHICCTYCQSVGYLKEEGNLSNIIKISNFRNDR